MYAMLRYAIRDLFNEWRGVQICYKQPAKRFPQVKYHREEQKNCIKIWSLEDDFASTHWFLKEYERPSWRAEQNRSRSNGNGYWRKSQEEPERARLCKDLFIWFVTSVHLLFCFRCIDHLLCRVWHLCDLPCGVHALFRLIFTAKYFYFYLFYLPSMAHYIT